MLSNASGNHDSTSYPVMRCAAITIAALCVLAAVGGAGTRKAASAGPDLRWFLQAASADNRQATAALDLIATVWKNSYASMIIDMARLMRPSPRAISEETSPARLPDDEPGGPTGQWRRDDFPEAQVARRGSPVRARLIRFLEKQTGRGFGDDLGRWREWMWKLPYEPHPDYAEFKGTIYGQIDPKMRAFFPPHVPSVIRLDEVDWGGVVVNGIPPLDHPKHITAREATYLRDKHLVFGVVMNGEARAYPKRILAWHEMARDRIGGVELTIVYCTLCGTVIPYESVVGGKPRTFGTSGLLYRSNKLMFDEETASLWSTLEGTPVVGSLVGSGLTLQPHAVVTTTWGEWKTEHPETLVLSLDTGYERDYSEGAAYREYFSTDQLIFRVSNIDDRLKNKAEVLVMLLTPPSDAHATRQPVAILADSLRANPVYHPNIPGHALVVITSPGGANRVFTAGTERFVRRLENNKIEDSAGRTWLVKEDALELEADAGRRLARVPAQRAFWFGWYAQFPRTLLIK